MGGGHDNHNTRDGNTFSVTIISWQVVTTGGWPQHRGRNDRNVTLGPSPGPAQGMITIHCLRYSVTRYMLQCSPLPRSPHPMYTTPHITLLSLDHDSDTEHGHVTCLTCAMCGVTVCPHRQQVNTLYTSHTTPPPPHHRLQLGTDMCEGIALRV